MGHSRKGVAAAFVLAGSAVTFTARTASAAVLVSDDFNPAGTGGDLTMSPNNTVGTGLTGTYTSQPIIDPDGNNAVGVINRTADNANVLYPTNVKLPAPAGGTAQNGSNNYNEGSDYATLANPISLTSSGTYYFSYLVHDYAGGAPNYDAQLVFGNAATRIYAGFGYSQSTSISVTDTTTAPFNAISAAGNSFPTGFSYNAGGGGNGLVGFVLGEIVTTPSGSDTINAKIIPFTGGSTAAIPASGSAVSYDATYTTTLSGTLTQLGLFMAGPNFESIDAVRVGTTYADVTGVAVPEPASLAGLGLAGVGLLAGRRRRRG